MEGRPTGRERTTTRVLSTTPEVDEKTDEDTTRCQDPLEPLPADGSSDVALTSPIEFVSGGFTGNESIEFSTGGVPLAGTTTVDGDRVIFELDPSESMRQLTKYDVVLDWCGGPTETSWTTLVDAAYSVDLAAGTWVEPVGIGPLILGELDAMILLGMEGESGDELDALGASGTTAAPVSQDICVPTFDFPTADFTNSPDFDVGPTDFEVQVDDVVIVMEDAHFSGSIAGARIEDVVFTARLDSRSLHDLIGGSDPGDACDLHLAFGGQCVPCLDGQLYCMNVHMTDLTGQFVPNLVVDPITQQQANMNCN